MVSTFGLERLHSGGLRNVSKAHLLQDSVPLTIGQVRIAGCARAPLRSALRLAVGPGTRDQPLTSEIWPTVLG
jgi:hypothetical protein